MITLIKNAFVAHFIENIIKDFMKKIVLCGLMSISILVRHNDAQALDLNDFVRPAVGIAVAAVFLVTTPIAYIAGSGSSEAKRLEQKRLNLQEKTKQEKEKKREEAEKFVQHVQKKYACEIEIVGKGAALTQEGLDTRAAVHFNHQTPFIHVWYARQLEKDIAGFSDHYNEFSDEEREVVDKLEKSLKKVFDSHSLLFKNVVAKELQNEKIALAEQQKRDYDVAIKKEKFQAARLETERAQAAKNSIIELRDQAQSSIKLMEQNAKVTLNTVNDNTSALYANYLAHYRSILLLIQTEFDENGYHALSQQVDTLNKRMTKAIETLNNASNDISATNKATKECRECLVQISSALAQLKNSDFAQKKELEKISKIIDRMDDSLAVVSADVGDIKSGNFNGEASAPHF